MSRELKHCLLCSEQARPKAKWSAVLDSQVAESLIKLLEGSNENFLDFFRNAEYCSPCQEFVLEIDFLMRSLASLQSRISESRAILTGCLKDQMNQNGNSDPEAVVEVDLKPNLDLMLQPEQSMEEFEFPNTLVDNEFASAAVHPCEPSAFRVAPVLQIPGQGEFVAPPRELEFLNRICGQVPETSEVQVSLILTSSEPSVPADPVRSKKRTRNSTRIKKPEVSYNYEISDGIDSEKSEDEVSVNGDEEDEDFVASISDSDLDLESEDDETEIHKTKKLKQQTSPIARNSKNTSTNAASTVETGQLPMRTTLGYDCFIENCTKSYWDAHSLRRHLNEKHPDRTTEEDKKLIPPSYGRPCKVSGCMFFSKSQDQHKKHLQSTHNTGIKHFRCESCSEKFQNSADLLLHKNKLHKKITFVPFKCQSCTAEYEHLNDLRVHENIFHKNMNYMCDSCGEAFELERQLQAHCNANHNAFNWFPCSVCSKKLLSEEDWDYHEARHTASATDGLVNWKCVVDMCNLQFENQDLLKQHVLETHDQDSCMTLKTEDDLFESPVDDDMIKIEA